MAGPLNRDRTARVRTPVVRGSIGEAGTSRTVTVRRAMDVRRNGVTSGRDPQTPGWRRTNPMGRSGINSRVRLDTTQVRDMRTPKPQAKGRVLAVTRGSAQAKKVGLRRQLAGEKARGYNQRARATISHLDTLAKQGVGLPLGAGAGGAARLASRALAGRIILPPVTARGLLPAAAIASGKLLQNVYRDSVEMPKRAAVAKKTIAARRHRARQRTKSG